MGPPVGGEVLRDPSSPLSLLFDVQQIRIDRWKEVLGFCWVFWLLSGEERVAGGGRGWSGVGGATGGPERDRGCNCGGGVPSLGLAGRGLGSFEVSGDGSGDRSIRGTSEGEGSGGDRRGRGEWLRDRGPPSREGPLDQSRRGGVPDPWNR